MQQNYHLSFSYTRNILRIYSAAVKKALTINSVQYQLLTKFIKLKRVLISFGEKENIKAYSTFKNLQEHIFSLIFLSSFFHFILFINGCIGSSRTSC